jgi:hypothetical protein
VNVATAGFGTPKTRCGFPPRISVANQSVGQPGLPDFLVTVYQKVEKYTK